MTPLETKLLIEKIQDWQMKIFAIESKLGENYEIPEELKKINNDQVHKLKLDISSLLDTLRDVYYKKESKE